MATQKRKIKRKYAATVADLQIPGVLLPSQWGLAESENSLVMKHSDGIGFTIIGGVAPLGSFINNTLSNTPQNASFNITGNAKIGTDIFLGGLTYSPGTTKIESQRNELLIKNFGKITLECDSGSIIMNPSDGNVLSLPKFDDTSTPPSNFRPGSIYFDTNSNTLKFYDSTSWVTIGTGGSGEVNTASNLFDYGNANSNIPADFGIFLSPTENTLGLFAGKSGVDLQFRSLHYTVGEGILISQVDTDWASLKISNTHTINNTGAGAGVLVQGTNNGAELYKEQIGDIFIFNSLYQGSSKISIINNLTGTILIDVNESQITLDFLNGFLSASKGGTGLTSYAIGDILYADSLSSLVALPISLNSGYVLTVVGGLPAWTAPTVGFTNPMTTLGDMIYGGVSGTPQALTVGNTGDVLTVIGGQPKWVPNSSGVISTTITCQWGSTPVEVTYTIFGDGKLVNVRVQTCIVSISGPTIDFIPLNLPLTIKAKDDNLLLPASHGFPIYGHYLSTIALNYSLGYGSIVTTQPEIYRGYWASTLGFVLLRAANYANTGGTGQFSPALDPQRFHAGDTITIHGFDITYLIDP